MKTSSLSPNGAGTVNPRNSRPIIENNVIGIENRRATRNRLRMSRTISSIDPWWPPCPITSCAERAAGPWPAWAATAA